MAALEDDIVEQSSRCIAHHPAREHIVEGSFVDGVVLVLTVQITQPDFHEFVGRDGSESARFSDDVCCLVGPDEGAAVDGIKVSRLHLLGFTLCLQSAVIGQWPVSFYRREEAGDIALTFTVSQEVEFQDFSLLFQILD
jgi:hypothetical protein